MKQLIEEQKKEKDVAEILKILAWQQVITSQGAAYTGEKDWALNKILDWHKQSFKQFIDELLVKLEEKIKVIEKRQRDFTNDPLHPFNAHLLGTKDALKGQISHLKELKEEIN